MTKFNFVKTLPFSDWDDFKTNCVRKIIEAQEVVGKSSGESRLVYRGQACANWGLEATFDRHVNNEFGVSEKNVYDKFINSFIQRGLEHEILEENGLEGDERIFYFEALARHYGLPTRLLDWSYSPYIAAFFAFTAYEDCDSGMISVWCMDVDRTKEAFPSETTIQIKERPKKGNFRQLSQQGLYTRNVSNLSNINDYFDENKGRYDKTPERPLLFKCTIPKEEFSLALEDLEYMGISSLTMYNDMEGLVNYQRNEMKLYPDRYK